MDALVNVLADLVEGGLGQQFIFEHPRLVHVLLGGLVHLEHVCRLLLACGMYRGGHARLQRRSQMHMGL